MNALTPTTTTQPNAEGGPIGKKWRESPRARYARRTNALAQVRSLRCVGGYTEKQRKRNTFEIGVRGLFERLRASAREQRAAARAEKASAK